MASAAGNDRTLDALYAGLIQRERARLLAKIASDRDARDIERLRRTVPNASAGAAYLRALRILRQLHMSSPPMLLALGLGIERDTWMLAVAVEHAVRRRRTVATLHEVWMLVGYPVTEGEYRAILGLERAEPEPLDSYAEWLADFEGTEDGLNPAVAALLASLPPDLRREVQEAGEGGGTTCDQGQFDEDTRRATAITRRIRRLMDAAVRSGDLPKPWRSKDGSILPRGVLKDWGEGTSVEDYEPLPPAYHIPVLEVLGGGGARWDVRDDGEAAAVQARRADLLHVCAEIAIAGGLVGVDAVGSLTLEPPRSSAERNRAVADAGRAGNRGHDDERERMRMIAALHTRRRADLRAHEEAIAALQAGEFGGEDPLDPTVRQVLEAATGAEREFEAIWDAAVAMLAPYPGEDEDNWPPSLEDEHSLERLRPELDEHLRGEWDV